MKNIYARIRYGQTQPDDFRRRMMRQRLSIIVVVAIVAVTIGTIAVRHERVKAGSTSASKPLSVNASYELAAKFTADEDFGAAYATYTSIIADDGESAEALFGRAVAAARNGDYRRSVKDFYAAEKYATQSTTISLNLGYAFSVQSDYESAIKSYSNAIKLDPKCVDGYGNRARCNFELGRFKETVSDLSHLIRLVPDHVEARRNRAIALYNIGQYDSAVADLKWNESLQPASQEDSALESLAKIRAGRFAESLDIAQTRLNEDPNADAFPLLAAIAIDQLAKTDPSNSEALNDTVKDLVSAFQISQSSVREARGQLSRLTGEFFPGEYCEAKLFSFIDRYKSESDLSTTRSIASYQDGTEAFKAGDIYTAISYLQDSERLDPENYESVYLHAILLLNTNDLTGAELKLQQIVSSFPDNSDARTLLGIVLSRQEKTAQALEEFDHVVRIENTNPVAFANRSFVRFLIGTDYSGVIKDCERADRLGFSSASLSDLSGRAHAKLQQFEEALELHDQAVEAAPNNVSFRLNRAVAQRALGMPEKADLDVATALELDPRHPEAHYHSAIRLYQQGKDEEAHSSLTHAIESGYSSFDVEFLLAEVLLAMNQDAESLEILERIVDESSPTKASVMLADELLKAGRSDESWSLIVEVIKREDSPSQSSDLNARAMQIASRAAVARGNADQGHAILLRTLGPNDDPQDTVLKIGLSCQDFGHWDDSLRWLGEYIAYDGSSTEAWEKSALAFEKLEQYSKSLACYSKALIVDPKNIEIQTSHARMLVKLGNYNAAKAELDKILSTDAMSPEIEALIVACNQVDP